MSKLNDLAQKTADLQFFELPPEVITEARYCLLDTIGCGLLGSSLPEGKAIVSALRKMAGTGSAPVWGTDVCLPIDSCAMACGSLTHLRELDDVHYSIVHPGSVCVPAAVAVAHTNDLTLRELLFSIVLGYEVMIRVATGINYMKHRLLGWHATATCGSFGAAATTAKLLGLDATQTTWALGLAGSRTGGTWAFKADGTMSKRLHPGLAARDGVAAAYLAQSGVTGPAFVLEAEDGGFYRVASDDWNLDELTADWGQTWGITEMEYKWYAACKSVHSPIEAAKSIQKRMKQSAADIETVTVRVNSSGVAMAGHMYDPESVASAQLSIPYGVALALLGGEGGAADYATDKIKCQQAYDLAQKVKVVPSKELNQLRVTKHKSAAEVEVTWSDGSVEYARVEDPKGSIHNPLSKDELEQKFLSLAAPVVGSKAAEQLIAVITGGNLTLKTKNLTRLLSPIGR